MGSFSIGHWLVVAVLAVPVILVWLIIHTLIRRATKLIIGDTKNNTKKGSRLGRLAVLALLVFGVPAAMHLWDSLWHSAFALDPCSLLTPEEVAAVIGAPVLVAQRLDETQCRYQQPGEMKPGQWNLLTAEAALQGADTKFSMTRLGSRLLNAPPGFVDATVSPPVGDASFFLGTPLRRIFFYARRGDAYVGIDMRASGGDSSVVGPTLAAKALDRMKF